jgi:hypothetical protein
MWRHPNSLSPLPEPAASSPTVPAPTAGREAVNLPAERRSWLAAIVPAYLGIFIWTPFYDRLWINDLLRENLAWLFASAVGAGIVCHVLFYRGLADWGFRTGLPVEMLATSTFGTAGARWITGVAVGLANVLIAAIAVDFSISSTLLGLCSCRLLDPANLAPVSIGPLRMAPLVFLATALYWTYIIGMATQLRLVGVVAGLMGVYTPVALLVLTAIAIYAGSALRVFSFNIPRSAISSVLRSTVVSGGPSALQLICGYFALAGLASAGRGALVKSRRDVLLGGATGIVIAAAWSASAALVVVAGTVEHLGRTGSSVDTTINHAEPLSFRWAVIETLGGPAGGTIMMLLGLAALAPAVYAAMAYGEKLRLIWPRWSETAWRWGGGLCACAIAITTCASRTELIFSLLGDLLAPVIGAMLADRLGQRGGWAGPRGAVNVAGLIAWAGGSAAALALDVAAIRSPGWSGWITPTSVLGLIVSGILYRLLAAAGYEPAAEPEASAAGIPMPARTIMP